MMWKRMRPAVLAVAVGVAATLLPMRSQAQLTMLGSCAPGSPCDLLRFSMIWGGLTPVDFYALTLTLAGGSPWMFMALTGDPVNAQDSFGPFPGAVVTNGSAGSVTIQFADPSDPTQVGFSLLDFPPFFTPQGYVDLWASGAGNTSFTFVATDAAGMQYSGTGAIRVGVVPEPMSLTLVGTGLLGLAAARRRRKQLLTG